MSAIEPWFTSPEPIECIIFDMDGTLVNSERLNFRALMDLVPAINTPSDDLMERHGGRKLTDTFKAVETEYGLDLPANFETIFRARVGELINTELVVFEGVYEALREVDVPFCIATNAPRKKVDHILAKTGLDEFFRGRIFSAYEVGAWKPEPELFLAACATMGFEPAQCLVVEDSQAGIDAGLAAGMNILHHCAQGRVPLHENRFGYYRDFISVLQLERK